MMMRMMMMMMMMMISGRAADFEMVGEAIDAAPVVVLMMLGEVTTVGSECSV